MKKLFLILIAGFFAFGLSGCAKSTPNLKFHTYWYYLSHKQLAGKVYNLCNEFYPGWNLELPTNRKIALRNANCHNAKSAYTLVLPPPIKPLY
ncbi:MAG: hypothetical protein ACYCSQ_07535 [bacterium]